MSAGRLDEKAWQQMVRVRDICRASKTQDEAKSEIAKAGLWGDFLIDFEPFRMIRKESKGK